MHEHSLQRRAAFPTARYYCKLCAITFMKRPCSGPSRRQHGGPPSPSRSAAMFRHAFATHLLDAGHNIRVLQELMGHKDGETTMIYTHLMNNSLAAIRSSVDALCA
jgi:integrase